MADELATETVAELDAIRWRHDSPEGRPTGTTFCPCGAAWIGTIDHGMAEQRSHAHFHASGGSGLGAAHDPGLATFTPDAPPVDPLRRAAQEVIGAFTVSPGITTGRQAKAIDALFRALDGHCERQRPTGPDGKHGDRHTATCGCDL